METDMLMHHARKMSLLADEYRFLQDHLSCELEDVQWMAAQVSELRVSLIRMSHSLQSIALDRTRDKLHQLELDYASGVVSSLAHPDHAKAIGDLCKTRE